VSESSTQRSPMSITRVQQWVASSVIFMVGMGIAGPMAAVSQFMEDGRGAPGAAVGLWIMSALWGVATAAAILIVHQHRLLSAWLLLGLVPAAVAFPFML
jgi:hypothetical protein